MAALQELATPLGEIKDEKEGGGEEEEKGKLFEREGSS